MTATIAVHLTLMQTIRHLMSDFHFRFVYFFNAHSLPCFCLFEQAVLYAIHITYRYIGFNLFWSIDDQSMVYTSVWINSLTLIHFSMIITELYVQHVTLEEICQFRLGLFHIFVLNKLTWKIFHIYSGFCCPLKMSIEDFFARFLVWLFEAIQL